MSRWPFAMPAPSPACGQASKQGVSRLRKESRAGKRAEVAVDSIRAKWGARALRAAPSSLAWMPSTSKTP
jgi:hypothetical protein